MELDAVADELYALPLAEFVATRNARAKAAKAAGEADLAKAISGLAKPAAAAWLANRLVRDRPAEVSALIELGAQLREATASRSGDQLRALGKQQRQLVAALVAQARDLSGSQGPRVTPETARALQDTLHAALADTAAAEQLLEARLTEPLRRSGFELDGAETAAGLSAPSPRVRAKSSARAGRSPLTLVAEPAERTVPAERAVPADRTVPAERTVPAGRAVQAKAKAKAAEQAEEARRRQLARRAEERLATAQRRADAAASERDQARAAWAEADQAQKAASERVRRLRAELERAVADQASAETAERRGRATLDKAERRHRQAVRDLSPASDRQGRIGP